MVVMDGIHLVLFQADLVVWDPNGTKTISVEDHNLKADTNVFSGITVHGIVDSVVISGRIVIDEGQLRVMQGMYFAGA